MPGAELAARRQASQPRTQGARAANAGSRWLAAVLLGRADPELGLILDQPASLSASELVRAFRRAFQEVRSGGHVL